MHFIFCLICSFQYSCAKGLSSVTQRRIADGGGGVTFSRKKRYEGARFNVVSVMRGGWGSNFQKKALRNT